MSRTPLSLLVLFALSCGTPAARAAQDLPIERGAAITDPLALRELDRGKFGLRDMLAPERSADLPLGNRELFALPVVAPIRAAIEREFERYVIRHRQTMADATIGVGEAFDFQLFDAALLFSPDTRFALAGIVNRMDRAYLPGAGCGEIRVIYRLVHTDAPLSGDIAASNRLPMTLNLVVRARPDSAAGRTAGATACSDIARRWLAAGELRLSGAALAERLLAADGPLDPVDRKDMVRIETNLQIAHAPKSPARDFRTDYLLKVFDYDSDAKRFVEAPLDNQIDRDRILADEDLRREFRAWLVEPAHLRELDRGTVLIPEKFLATRAIVPTPAGFDASELQTEFGMVEGEDAPAPAFTQRDIVGALKQAAEQGAELQNIRSPAGFARRLNDITCAGCHQTRGIGGFHFPGVDWMAARPSNATVVPASPHFFGDQVRRRDILAAFRDSRQPDFSRGFSSRPQTRGNPELAGTEYEDGWGAHCYRQSAKPADNDRSFWSWTCAEGLACQAMGTTSRIGMCFVGAR